MAGGVSRRETPGIDHSDLGPEIGVPDHALRQALEVVKAEPRKHEALEPPLLHQFAQGTVLEIAIVERLIHTPELVKNRFPYRQRRPGHALGYRRHLQIDDVRGMPLERMHVDQCPAPSVMGHGLHTRELNRSILVAKLCSNHTGIGQRFKCR